MSESFAERWLPVGMIVTSIVLLLTWVPFALGIAIGRTISSESAFYHAALEFRTDGISDLPLEVANVFHSTVIRGMGVGFVHREWIYANETAVLAALALSLVLVPTLYLWGALSLLEDIGIPAKAVFAVIFRGVT